MSKLLVTYSPQLVVLKVGNVEVKGWEDYELGSGHASFKQPFIKRNVESLMNFIDSFKQGDKVIGSIDLGITPEEHNFVKTSTIFDMDYQIIAKDGDLPVIEFRFYG